MKRIEVPADVPILNPTSKQPILDDRPGPNCGKPYMKSYRDYAFDCWLNDPRIAQTRAQLRRRATIEASFDEAVGGTVQYLEDADYATVKAIVEERALVYSAGIEQQCLGFDDAFLAAKDVKAKDVPPPAQTDVPAESPKPSDEAPKS